MKGRGDILGLHMRITGDQTMSQQILVHVEVPSDLVRFHLPEGVDHRLQSLLERQDRGEKLTAAERLEAEGLVNLSEFLTLLKLRAERAQRES